MTTKDLMMPSIHLNGTSVDSLTEGYLATARALTIALDKMSESAPNARDYYPQGDDAFARAKKQHQERFAALHRVKEEIEALYQFCADSE